MSLLNQVGHTNLIVSVILLRLTITIKKINLNVVLLSKISLLDKKIKAELF